MYLLVEDLVRVVQAERLAEAQRVRLGLDAAKSNRAQARRLIPARRRIERERVANPG